MRIDLKNKLSELEKIRWAIEEFAAANNLGSRMAFELNLILEELFTNIISYGYAGGREHKITLSLEYQDEEVNLELTDGGVPFNPLEAPLPDIAKPIKERRVGGLGIFLVRTYADRIDYRRENKKNVLTIRKKIKRVDVTRG